jgi:ArsR family transcriptional regulator
MDTITSPPRSAIGADAPHLEALQTLFRALSDRTRMRIVALLAQGEICVCEIHESLGIPQPTASRHLAYLRRSGLVQDRRQGLWVYYRLSEQADPVVRGVVGAVGRGLDYVRAKCCDPSGQFCLTERGRRAGERGSAARRRSR